MDGFMTRFIRRDGRPAEEYYYHSLAEAEHHMNLFRDDDSDLYDHIDVVDLKTMKQKAVLNFR
jgi:hypothetical protein